MKLNGMSLWAVLIAVALLVPAYAFAGKPEQETIGTRSEKDMKILVAYFSRRGQNYASGEIVELKIGNTEAVAKMIQAKLGADLFEIKTVKPYPLDYRQTTEVAKQEQRKDARPKLTASVQNFGQYEVVILGYPNWWGTMPMAVKTFLESYDFAGKTIAPFCTHEGSGLGMSVTDIKRLCPKAQVLKGLAIHGTHAQEAGKEVEAWLKKIGVAK